MSKKEIQPKPAKPLYKKWWFIALVAVFLIGAIGSLGGESEGDTNIESTSTESSSEAPSAETTEVETTEAVSESSNPAYTDGMYKVGVDIEPGLYKAKLTSSLGLAYIERSKDSSMSFDSILANVNLTGDGYVTIKESDAFVKITGAELTLFDLDSVEVSFKDEYEDGMYLVGIDIEPGEYKVVVTDKISGIGYVERVSDASFDFDSIIANTAFQGQEYITVSDTDFAIRLQGVKMTK